jgi:integrating conjugative element protein (TIGR03759 family)
MRKRLEVPMDTTAASNPATHLVVATILLTLGLTTNAQDGTPHQETTITETRQTQLSASEIAQAKVWSLNEAEWRRYRSLMQGIRGSVSPATLSPIEVLGIHARDAAERRQYAERWAIAMHEDAERILKFQRAYDVAFERLYPGQMLIDMAALNGGDPRATKVLATDRILLRVALNCPSCDAVLAKALRRLDDVAGIDIYVVNTGESDQAAIRKWAGAQAIQPEWVRSRRVTLNIDKASFGLTKENEPPPTLYVRRGERIERLAYAAL